VLVSAEGGIFFPAIVFLLQKIPLTFIKNILKLSRWFIFSKQKIYY